MKEALSSSETSVLTRDTLRNLQEDTILHSHHRQILKPYRPHEGVLYILCTGVITEDANFYTFLE
jgi:hypothetical protein